MRAILKNSKIIFVAFVVIILFSPVGVLAIGLDLYYLSNQAVYESGGTKASPSNSNGYGLGLEFGLGPHTGIQIGYQQVKRGIQSATNTRTLTYTEYPVIFVYRPFSIVRMGAGIYSAQANKVVASSDNIPTNLESIGIVNPDMGAILSLGVNFNIKSSHWLLEGRYTKGLYNLSSNTDIIAKYDQTQVLLGLCLGNCNNSRGAK